MNSSCGCRMCFDKFKLKDLSKDLLLCKNCENIPISQTFKQCKFCRSDFKNSVEGDTCSKCRSQIQKHGDPSNCTICDLQMAFGNEVICIRCSHYRSKFGDAKKCDNCLQFSAFYKDKSSRDKVDGKLLCWLCTYFYKLQKAKAFKASKRRVDVTKSNDVSTLTRNDSSNNITTEPINKKNRIEEDNSFPMYSNDAAYNEQLVKVNQLQEEVKDLRRKLSTKESELLAKDNLITGLKADIIQQEKDSTNREIILKSRWQKEKESLLDKLKTIHRENARLSKTGKKKRQVVSGYEQLTRNPLTMAPSSFSNSPKNSFTNSPKPTEKQYSKLSVDLDNDSPKPESKEGTPAPDHNSDIEDKSINKSITIPTKNKDQIESNKCSIVDNTDSKTDKLTNDTTNNTTTENETPELSLNSNSKDSSSVENSP